MDTPWGPMGNLICWESYMPLARVALYQKGISLYISPNTNDNPEWQDTIRHIAIEGHCYFINADLVFRRSDYPQTVSGTAEIAAPAGHRLPGRQLRHRPLRPRGLRHRLGQGGHHLRRPGYAEGPRQPYGAGLRGPLCPSRRAGAARQREIKRKRPPAGRAFFALQLSHDALYQRTELLGCSRWRYAAPPDGNASPWRCRWPGW